MNMDAVRERVASVIAEVMRHAVRDAGADGVVILDDGTPEARLAIEWTRRGLGSERVHAVAPPGEDELSALLLALDSGTTDRTRARHESHRLRARLEAAARGALLAHPANKTALLLGGEIPPEPLLPLGDLYASQIEDLTGEWSAPDSVRRLAEAAGGISILDEALTAWAEERRPLLDALNVLPRDVAGNVGRLLEAGRFARRRVGLVPKLGFRTLGIDLLG
mgnify:CR=1 FL=1